MPQSTDQHQPRARSLSTGTAPARAVDDATDFDNSNKRAAIPRAASTLGMYNTAKADQEAEDPFRDIAREQVDRETLRDLAHFFRNTRPPTTRHMDLASAENCFGKTAGDGSKRWSIRSLRRGAKGQNRPRSLQLRDSTILKTTAAGHQYMAISVPASGPESSAPGRPSLQSRLTALQQSHIAPMLGSPRRNSSADMQGPTSPTSSKTNPSKHDSADLAAVVSRSSSRLDKNPFRLSIRVSTAEPGVRSLLKLVDEWLEDQHNADNPGAAIKGQHLIGPAHPKKGSVATILSPVPSETVAEEQDQDAFTNTPTTAPTTAPTPTIMVKEAFGSSPTMSSPDDAPDQTMSLPKTPPPTDSQHSSFPGMVPRPQSAGASMGSPRSPESASRVALSAFPNTSSGRRSPVRSPKQQQKKPANISVKRTLEVPQTQIQPDSPGFPKMLAAMTFPSPPESIKSHSASNSIASTDPSRSVATPPLTGRTSATSPTPSSLDQRIMHPARPTLKHYKSDSAFNSSYVSQRSIASSLGTYDGGSAEINTAMKARSEHRPKPSYTYNKPSRLNLVSAADDASERRASMDSTTSTRRGRASQRQSTASTTESSRQSIGTSERHRHSIRSETSAASDVTATDEVYGKGNRTDRSSVGSSTLDERRRSETQCSTRSVSSNGTHGTAASLAERRMARRARVREKVQRDLESTKIKNIQVQKPHSFSVADSVDSPVLGWFSQIGSGDAHPHGPKKTQGPSRLALQSSTPDTPPETTPTEAKFSRHIARKSSAGDISQLIPETVEETTTPVTPKAPQRTEFSFTPIMAEQTEPDPDPEPEPEQEEPSTPTPSSLTLSTIMTVANIEAEAHSPESNLRPLSLLANGSAPPIVPPRSTLRPERNQSVRQRPIFPVRVSKNPLELTVNTTTKSKRNSSPHIPTPPISPDPGSPRLSFSSIKPSSAPPSTNYHQSWAHPHQHSRQTQSLKDKETEWLTNHQRQTAEDWRLEALMRREKLERELAQDAIAEDADQEVAKETPVITVEDKRRQPKERHRRSTLRILNSNAGPSSTSSGAISDAGSNITDDEKTPTTVITHDEKDTAARRASEAEVEARLLKTLMPLLQNMQSTLNEMQRDSASKELSQKFMESALAVTSMKPLAEETEKEEEEEKKKKKILESPSQGLSSNSK